MHIIGSIVRGKSKTCLIVRASTIITLIFFQQSEIQKSQLKDNSCPHQGKSGQIIVVGFIKGEKKALWPFEHHRAVYGEMHLGPTL